MWGFLREFLGGKSFYPVVVQQRVRLSDNNFMAGNTTATGKMAPVHCERQRERERVYWEILIFCFIVML